MTGPEGPHTTRRGGRLAAAAVLLTIAVAGIAAGVVLDRYVILPRRFDSDHGVVDGGGARRRGGGMRNGERERRGGRQEFHDRLARLLDLTPEQRVQLDTVMARQARDLREAHAAAQPRVDSIVRRTRRQLDSLFTPAQREKLRALRDSGGWFGAQPGRRRGGRPDR